MAPRRGTRLAEMAARALAQANQIEATRGQAEMALDQGLALCDRSEVGHGLLRLARSMELADRVGPHNLERAARINLGDWSGRLLSTRWKSEHRAPILDLAFSADGQILVSVGKDQNIRVWDSQTGRELGPPMVADHLGESKWVGRVAFAPGSDRTIVTGDIAGHALCWDVPGRRRSSPPLLHPATHMIWGLAFSPDGTRLFTCCDDGRARIWEAATGKLSLAPLVHGDEQGYYTLAVSSDGRTLATGGKDSRVRLWDTRAGSPIGVPFLCNGPVHMLAFLRNGTQLITGTRDGALQVWDITNARMTDLPAQGTSVTGLAVSPHGDAFATGTLGGVLRLWDPYSMRQTAATCELVVGVTGLAFHPDGRSLAVGQNDGSVRLLNIPGSKSVGPELRTGSAVHMLAFSPGGERLLTGSAQAAQWWDLKSGKSVGTIMHDRQYEPREKVRSPDGKRTLDVVDMIEATTWAHDGKTVALAGWTGHEERVRGRVAIWDPATGARLDQTDELPNPLYGAVYTPDCGWLLTWDENPGSTMLWNTRDLKVGKPVLRSLDVRVRHAVFAPRGDYLLVACQDGTVRFWDVAGDVEIAPKGGLAHGYPVTAAAFDPAGQRAITGCQGGIVCLWSLPERRFLRDMRGNAGEVDAVAFSPDGSMIATGSHDGTARFWDAESGRQLGPSLRHNDAVLALAFHPDGRTIAAGTKNGSVKRWHVPAAPLGGSVAEIQALVKSQTGLEARSARGRAPVAWRQPCPPESQLVGHPAGGVANRGGPVTRTRLGSTFKLIAATAALGIMMIAFAWVRSRFADDPTGAASTAYAHGDWRQAEAQARAILKKDPSNLRAVRLLARAVARQGRDDSVDAFYRRLGTATMEPEDYFLLGARF